jgi:hypothetical protein
MTGHDSYIIDASDHNMLKLYMFSRWYSNYSHWSYHKQSIDGILPLNLLNKIHWCSQNSPWSVYKSVIMSPLGILFTLHKNLNIYFHEYCQSSEWKALSEFSQCERQVNIIMWCTNTLQCWMDISMELKMYMGIGLQDPRNGQGWQNVSMIFLWYPYYNLTRWSNATSVDNWHGNTYFATSYQWV